VNYNDDDREGYNIDPKHRPIKFPATDAQVHEEEDDFTAEQMNVCNEEQRSEQFYPCQE